jgi:hypothetical protein
MAIVETRSSQSEHSRYFDDSIRGGKGIGSRFLILIGDDPNAPKAREQLAGSLADIAEVRSAPRRGSACSAGWLHRLRYPRPRQSGRPRVTAFGFETPHKLAEPVNLKFRARSYNSCSSPNDQSLELAPDR